MLYFKDSKLFLSELEPLSLFALILKHVTLLLIIKPQQQQQHQNLSQDLSLTTMLL